LELKNEVYFNTERGFSEGTVDSCRPSNIYVTIVGSKPVTNPKVKQPVLIVKVTYSNATPRERKIGLRIDSTYPTGFRYVGSGFVECR
jgi:hypothetical protein